VLYRTGKIPRHEFVFIEFVIFGILTHLGVLLCQVFLIFPYWNGWTVAKNIAPFFLILYPLLTGIVAMSLANLIERQTSRDRLIETRRLLQAAIDSPQTVGVFAVDTNLRYLAFNEYYRQRQERLFGRKIFIGQLYEPPFPDELKEKVVIYIREALQGRPSTHTLKVTFDEERYVRTLYSPIPDENGGIGGATVFVEDVTEMVMVSEENRRLSYHDYLTGLFNRRYYGELLQKIETENRLPVAFLIADINGLKLVNDAFGHHAGDELLLKVSRKLTAGFGPTAAVMRIGGDEFVMILEGELAATAAETVEKVKTEMEREVLFGINVSVSFGLAFRRTGELMEDVMKRAESEMYARKLFEVSSQRAESIRSILNTLYVKNPREEFHSRRVSDFCLKIGQFLGLPKDQLNQLKLIGNLHDIGKIAIDEAILNKPGKLTPEEWSEIRRHPETGYRLLITSSEFAEMAEDILAHHEHWDGSGYPKGLRGEAIPWRARLIAIADAFDAMTAPRPYRQSLSTEAALQEILRCAGTQFDPELAPRFVEGMLQSQSVNP
ncbi:MAG TPA: diguanylate cyclase, partial [Candidatus Izemoplasmatales bacterium]|nr:diguanylate cyclase [Candidatus Izemoplasmatales bacterium]